MIQKYKKVLSTKKVQRIEKYKKSSVILKKHKKSRQKVHIQFSLKAQKSTNLGQESKSTNKYLKKYTKSTKKVPFQYYFKYQKSTLQNIK